MFHFFFSFSLFFTITAINIFFNYNLLFNLFLTTKIYILNYLLK